jgi:hypothetical protein
MARGLLKGNPDPVLATERAQIERRLKMNAREIFEVRAAVLAARRPVVVVDEGVTS